MLTRAVAFLSLCFFGCLPVECTTQVVENLNPTSAVTYTVAATDTLFRVKNVDTTGTNSHIYIEFPADGVLAPNLVIEIEDCDIANGALYFGHSQGGTHKQAHFVDASITIRNNNAGTFTFMYADGAGSQLTSTYGSSTTKTTMNIHNNGFGDIRLFDSWNAATNTATVSGGSSFSLHSSSAAGNYFRIAKTENSGASAHITVTGSGSLFEVYGFTRTAVSGLIVVALALNMGSSQLTVSAGGAFKMYQNTVYQIEVGRGPGSTIEVLGAGSTLELNSNTLGQTLTLCLAAVCSFSESAVISVSQNTANDLMVAYTVGGTVTMTITRSTLSVVGNAVSQWLNLCRAESTGVIDFTATESSLVEVSSNSCDLLRIGRAMTTSSLSFTVSKSSVIDCVGNSIAGVNNLIIMQSSSSTTFSMSSSSRFNVVGNNVPSSEVAFFYGSSGGSTTATVDTSSIVDISENTVLKLRFGLTSSTSSLTVAASKSSSVKVQKNEISGTICSFGYTSSGNSASMTAETAGIFSFEDNDAPSASCLFCAGAGTCSITTSSSARKLGPS